jgi:hypothetical protein
MQRMACARARRWEFGQPPGRSCVTGAVFAVVQRLRPSFLSVPTCPL